VGTATAAVSERVPVLGQSISLTDVLDYVEGDATFVRAPYITRAMSLLLDSAFLASQATV
jgi:hypothetical protein